MKFRRNGVNSCGWFWSGRKEKVVDKVTEEIGKALDVSTVESDCFRFTGIDVKKVNGGIEISMDDYAKSLDEIQLGKQKQMRCWLEKS